jgi:opacity protein-like surface antigen
MIYRIISLGCTISLGLWAEVAASQDYWAGTYGGIALSFAEADAGLSGNTTHQFEDRAATLGLYVGRNFVRENGFVWGPEVLLTGLGSSGTASDTAVGRTKMEGSFLLSPRVRGGFATDRTFFYGVLGLGVSDLTVQERGNDDLDITITPAIGIGAEFAMQDGWSARIEAMHYDFDGRTFTASGTDIPIKADVKQITLGLSRKF